MAVLAARALVGGMGVIVELAVRLRIDHVAGGEMRPFLDRSAPLQHLR